MGSTDKPQNDVTGSPAEKRKAEDQLNTSPKQTRTGRTAPLVSLKNTRLTLRQKPVGWDRTMPVLRAVLAFQSFLAENTKEPLLEVPAEHLGAIASLVQESDKSLTELAKTIRATLLPEGQVVQQPDGQEADVLNTLVIQNTIQALAQRTNYGIESIGDTAVPPSLQLWRWEVNDLDLLPKENLEKLLTRRSERIQARTEAMALIEALPVEKQQALFSPKKNRSKVAEGMVQMEPPSSPKNAEEEAAKPSTSVPREKSERTKLRETRRAERLAKEEKVEKTKKAQVRLFNSFFQQAAPKPTTPKPDDQKTDFERTFLPCQIKNLAEINKFVHSVDDDFPSHLDSRERAPSDLLSEFKHKFGRPTVPRPRGIHPAISVRNIMKSVTESDVLGGDAEEEAKRGLEKLNDRRLIPLKLLQFQTDRRPGWMGTWTRSSTFITPRRPLGQDPVALDYTYDSEAEWDVGEEGENVDDMDDRDEESGASSDEDSEMADWLEDDLEVEDELVPEVQPVSEDCFAETKQDKDQSRGTPNTTNENVLKPRKKVKLLGRRFDSKLVPFITGPHWENTLTVSNPESFDSYCISMLNDAYIGLNPFNFTTTMVTIDQEGTDKPLDSPTSATVEAGPQPAPSASRVRFNFPDSHLPELLRLIQGSTRSKPALIEDLHEHFKPTIKGVSKAAIEFRLQECATRESKKPGAKWVIKQEWQNKLENMTE